MKSLFCPISSEKVEENVVRITGLFIAILIFFSIAFHLPLLMGMVLTDYFIRAFAHQYTSPLSRLGKGIVKHFNIDSKLIAKAPKIFAARIGFSCALGGSLLYLASPLAGTILLSILMAFALLESLGNICAGCLVYTYATPRKSKQL